MSWRTSPPVIALRSILRRSGFKALIARLPLAKGYELNFERAMLASIRPGDCVWDIGANVGLYSKRFSALVGSSGQVVCFEPSVTNLRKLRANVAGSANIGVFELALSDHGGTAVLQQGADSLGATSRLIQAPTAANEGTGVRIARGDDLIEQESLPLPNLLKVDTEGHELEVLRGLAKHLACPALRAVCVEVHFGLLAERGMAHAPAEIESLLRRSGFVCHWTDASHIVARRRSE
jgi:FkbM family methyltransferase